MHDLVGLGGGGNEDAVDAFPFGPRLGRDPRVAARLDRLRAEAAGQAEAPRIDVDAEHLAPVGPEELDGRQANQAEPVDDVPFAEGGLKQPDALKADAPEDRERRLRVRHGVGHLGAEILRDADDLGVGAVRGDAVARLQARDAGPDLKDTSGVAVSERHGLVEFAEDGLEGRHEAIGANLVEDLADLLGLAPGLGDEGPLAELDDHALGARRDERRAGLDEQVARPHLGARDLGHLGLAVPDVLEDLSHVSCRKRPRAASPRFFGKMPGDAIATMGRGQPISRRLRRGWWSWPGA